jgi:hypothetical protein
MVLVGFVHGVQEVTQLAKALPRLWYGMTFVHESSCSEANKLIKNFFIMWRINTSWWQLQNCGVADLAVMADTVWE